MADEYTAVSSDKASKLTAFLGPFTKTYGTLVKLLDAIDQTTNSVYFARADTIVSVSVPPPPPAQVRASKVKKREPVSTAAGKAYGEGYTKAKEALKAVVDKLTPDQVNFMSGLGFTNPGDDAKKRTDILNSVVSAWDAPASKYMKGQTGEGIKGKAAMYTRLQQFDDALETQGKTPVPPDK
jgi:hypothetical protein